jgi:2-aminoethylphosphonate-pyruvate transaminase
MRIELVVFDMAGTTVHDGDAVHRCLAGALLAAGLETTRDEVNAVMGMPKPLAISSLMDRDAGRQSDAPGSSAMEIHEDFLQRMMAYYRTDPGVREVPGATAVLLRLREHGVKVALGTGFSRPIADAIIQRLGWYGGLLDATVTSDEVARGRPHADMVLRAMRLVGVRDPRAVAKVGDTPSDLLEGVAAGCGLVIGVTAGSHTQEELERHPHSHLIPTIADLPPLVLDRRLFTPGPLTTSQSVKAAMLRDLGTRDAEFVDRVRTIRHRLVDLADPQGQSEYTSVLMQGSGTFGVESVIGTAIPCSGRLLVLANGTYGERIVQIAATLGIDVGALRHDEDQTPTADEVREALDADRSITHVAMVHCETTTGILNPIEEIGPVVREAGCTFIVDAMSSFGAIPIDLHQCCIDYLVSTANKCIEGVPGFSFIIARQDMLMQTLGQARSVSLDLFDQWHALESDDGQFRFTPPVHVLLAFDQALDELDAEGGVEGRLARYRQNHRALMAGMKEIGFRPYLRSEVQSTIITTFHSPSESVFNFREFYDRLADKGYTVYAGKLSRVDTFRIGTIGRLSRQDVEALLKAVRGTLADMGIGELYPVASAA